MSLDEKEKREKYQKIMNKIGNVFEKENLYLMEVIELHVHMLNILFLTVLTSEEVEFPNGFYVWKQKYIEDIITSSDKTIEQFKEYIKNGNH